MEQGWLLCRETGGRAELTMEVPGGSRGLYRGYVLGERGLMDLGTLLPEGNVLRLRRNRTAVLLQQYKGSMDNFQDLRKLIKEQKYEDAYNTGKELLKKNPVSLQLLYNMYGLAGLLEKDIQEIKHYSKRYAALLTMISLTGDGTSEETAFKVICVNDEYQLLNMLFRMENMKSQSLVNKCDLIEFDKCQHYEGNQMYFDISRSLDYTSKLFGK